MTNNNHHPDYIGQPDEDLVPLLARQEVGALEAIYARHSRAVYSLSLKMLGDPTAAEEVVQECFLKLWRQPELYQATRGKLLSWLLGVTHHRAVDRLRRRRLEQRHAQDGQVELLSPDHDDPEQHAWSHFQTEALSRALGSLPREQRVALELAYVGGFTQAEIATLLDEPLGTIKTRTRLGMRKLRTVPELMALTTDRVDG